MYLLVQATFHKETSKRHSYKQRLICAHAYLTNSYMHVHICSMYVQSICTSEYSVYEQCCQVACRAHFLPQMSLDETGCFICLLDIAAQSQSQSYSHNYILSYCPKQPQNQAQNSFTYNYKSDDLWSLVKHPVKNRIKLCKNIEVQKPFVSRYYLIKL